MKPPDWMRNVASNSVGTGKSSNALRPLLWLCGVVGCPCFGLVAAVDAEFRWAFFAVGMSCVILFAGAYVYWAVRDPDRLGSEGFQLKSKALEIYASRASRKSIDRSDLEQLADLQEGEDEISDPPSGKTSR